MISYILFHVFNGFGLLMPQLGISSVCYIRKFYPIMAVTMKFQVSRAVGNIAKILVMTCIIFISGDFNPNNKFNLICNTY